MGYFDNIDSKIDKIQEVGEIERSAGVSFWYSIGALGLFLHGVILNLIFRWTILYLGLFFIASIVFTLIGLRYSAKSGKAAAEVHNKNELNHMARSYNLLWLIFDVVALVLNLYISISVIASSF